MSNIKQLSIDLSSLDKLIGFEDVLELLKKGYKVKRVPWKGYWCINDAGTDIEMHCEDNTVVLLSESDDMLFTISNILKRDWIIATEETCSLLSDDFGFEKAFRYLKEGKKISRRDWDNKYIDLHLGTIRCTDLNSKDTYTLNYLDDSTLEANDWYIYSDDKSYEFDKALDYIDNGFSVRLSSWDKNKYIKKYKGVITVFDNSINMGDYIPKASEILSKWVIVK